jgi:tetratricopeptide (TPR) repeat protein
MHIKKYKALDIRPEEFSAIFAMGENFYTQGQYKKAQIIFSGLIALDSYNHQASIAYGESLLLDNQSNKALIHFTNARSLFPASFPILLGCAKACIILKRYEEACIFLEPIIDGQIKVSPEISEEIKLLLSRLAS